MSAILVALCLNLVSVLRAHKNDFGLRRIESLQESDLEIVKMNKKYLKEGRIDSVYLENKEVAFAQFPVVVIKESAPYTLKIKL